MENINSNADVQLQDDYKTMILLELNEVERHNAQCVRLVRKCKGYAVLSECKHARRAIEDYIEFVSFMNIDIDDKMDALYWLDISLDCLDDARANIIEKPAQSSRNLVNVLKSLKKALCKIKDGKVSPYEEWLY